MSNKTGKVFLVGAGPGDEELLTVKALRLIEGAQVVVYDRLVGAGIMAKVPETALKINVGKNVGHHPVPQEEINRILLQKAQEGYDVVRLKGGDSFLFGRGGEELELLKTNGVPFEVVPGITSAIAAATYAGIPVTHRDFCSSLHIITGHRKRDGALSLDYPSLVKLDGTLIFMMSVANAGEIADGLIEAGMSPEMDCAVVENGTRFNQRKFAARLGGLYSVIAENEVKSPALIIVGKVCSLSEQFDWFSKLPLKGKRILVTRPKAKSGRLAVALMQQGAEVTQIPAIETTPLPFPFPDLEDSSLLVFTSGAGVEAFFARLLEQGLDARALGGKRVAVVGKETANELYKYGVSADFIPTVYSGEALAQEMLSSGFVTKSDRLLILRAKKAAPELTALLAANEISFAELAVYETNYQQGGIHPTAYDMVTFTSASCVEGFAQVVGSAFDFSAVCAVCIGEQTAKAAAKFGMKTHVAKEATIDAMVTLIASLST